MSDLPKLPKQALAVRPLPISDSAVKPVKKNSKPTAPGVPADPKIHQQTEKQAIEAWENEGDPN